MINILLISLALASPSDRGQLVIQRQREITEMRMEQTQPHYLPRTTPLPPGCGPFWDAQRAQRAQQALPRPFENQLYYYQPFYPHYYYPYYRVY